MQIFCAIIQSYYLKKKINKNIFIEINYKDNKILNIKYLCAMIINRMVCISYNCQVMIMR